MRARMPKVNTSFPRPRDWRRAAFSSSEMGETGATPFMTTVIFLGEMPASVRLSRVAGLTAMMWSA